MEVLVHDLIEEILEKLPVKSLLRFKSLSKQWKSTIESRNFQQKHLIHHQNSKKPDLLSITINDKIKIPTLKSMTTMELQSSISNNIQIPWETNLHIFCQNSCDVLICLYNYHDSTIVFNPATRCYRTLPKSTYQQRHKPTITDFNPLGFGKDQINGLYKPVWLYNSLELGLNNTTTCEVFDFNINAWRFIEPSSPKRIHYWYNPVYLNGLLYWLTKDEEPSVISLDLHTESFEIVCNFKGSFTDLILHNLDNSLCISENLGCSEVIWSLNMEEKTWEKMYFIDLVKICSFFGECWCAVTPLVLIEDKKRKLMLCDYYRCHGYNKQRVIIMYDSQHTSYHVIAIGEFTKTICYFPSLISIL